MKRESFKERKIGDAILCVILIFSAFACSSPNSPRPPYTAFTVNHDPDSSHEQNFSWAGDSVIAQLTGIRNYADTGTSFSLNKDTKVRLRAVGEGITYKMGSPLFKVWQNDNVEFYFDLMNNKSKSFDIFGDDRQYRICWRSKELTGMNFTLSGVEFKQSDPTSSSYIVEVKFPWKTLGFVRPSPGVVIGFEIAVADNDGYGRDLYKSWASSISGIDEQTDLYGNIILVDQMKKNISRQKEISAVFSKHPPIIDGKVDPMWNQLRAHRLDNTLMGSQESTLDLNASFKCSWDHNNIYFIVMVTDTCKKDDMGIFVDYGWLEDESGKVIWSMDLMSSEHAGGSIKNRYVDTVVSLPRGIYTLRYLSDESHAVGSWDDPPPLSEYYGIVVSEVRTQD